VTTKAEFLARIRGEMDRARGWAEAATAVRPQRPRERLEVLRRELSERWPETLERFAREFERVGGVLHRVRDAEAVPESVAGIAGQRGARLVVAWHDAVLGLDLTGPLAARGLQPNAAPDGEVTSDERQRRRALASVADLGVTGVDLAIAETGTLVVVSGAGRPRSA
jgi:L-lactate utilization protein LutB